MDEQKVEQLTGLVDQTIGTLVVAALWPEIASIKLLSTGDAMFTPAAHRYAEGIGK